MQTKNRKGIICDMCGKKIIGKIIEYYDMEVNKIIVDFNKKTTIPEDEGIQFDICLECYEKIKTLVMKKILENQEK